MRRLLVLLALAALTGCCTRIDFQQDVRRDSDFERRETETRGLVRFLYATCLWPQQLDDALRQPPPLTQGGP